MKAQITIEFIALIAVGIIIMSISLIVLNTILLDQVQQKQDALLKNFGESIQSELLLAAKSPQGYTRTVVIPEMLQGHNYSITSDVDGFSVSTATAIYSFRAPPLAGDGLAKGNNTLFMNSSGAIINSHT
ncbi:MAG: hypothetical protein V1725_05250 [archaeon]